MIAEHRLLCESLPLTGQQLVDKVQLLLEHALQFFADRSQVVLLRLALALIVRQRMIVVQLITIWPLEHDALALVVGYPLCGVTSRINQIDEFLF